MDGKGLHYVAVFYTTFYENLNPVPRNYLMKQAEGSKRGYNYTLGKPYPTI